MDKIKKFKEYLDSAVDKSIRSSNNKLIMEDIKLANMEMALDLTLVNDDDYVYNKTIEYLNAHK